MLPLFAGNLALLGPSSSQPPARSTTDTHSGNLVSFNGSVVNVDKLLQKAEQTQNSRLYLENKIHTLELKLGEQHMDLRARVDFRCCEKLFHKASLW